MTVPDWLKAKEWRARNKNDRSRELRIDCKKSTKKQINDWQEGVVVSDPKILALLKALFDLDATIPYYGKDDD